MDLPAPYDRIRRVLGHRSLPDDWPRFYDSWDAFDADGNFLVILHYKALAELLDGSGRIPHEVTMDFEDDSDGMKRLVVTPNMAFDMTMRIDLGHGASVMNPDRLVSKAELAEAFKVAGIVLMGGT